MTHKKIRILALSIFLLVFTLQVSSQEDSQQAEETTDPILLKKLKDIENMEMLLEITKSESIRTGAINDQREEEFLSARNRQRELLEEAKRLSLIHI